LPNGGLLVVRDKPLEEELEEQPAFADITSPEPMPAVEIGRRDLADFVGQVQNS
jgi:hypothetical protein